MKRAWSTTYCHASATRGIFYLAVAGNQLDNFDVLYDPTSQDQILVGKLGLPRQSHVFQYVDRLSGPLVPQRSPPRGAAYALDNIRIEAALQPDLTMQAVTRATLTLRQQETRVRFALQFVAQHARHRRQRGRTPGGGVRPRIAALEPDPSE